MSKLENFFDGLVGLFEQSQNTVLGLFLEALSAIISVSNDDVQLFSWKCLVMGEMKFSSESIPTSSEVLSLMS